MSVLNVLERFVGDEPRQVFSSVPELACDAGNLRFHTCVPNEKNTALPRPLRLLKCGGAGLTSEQARTAAIGEGLERYAATRYSLGGNWLKASFDELPVNALPPSAWQLHAPQQFADGRLALSPLTSRSVIKWYQAKNMASEETCWVPGPLSVFAYRRASSELRHFPTTSTGLALGDSAAAAKTAALLEVIERDCVTLAWTWRMPVRETRSDDSVLQDIIAELGMTASHRLRLYEISNETRVPVFLAVIEFTVNGHELLAVGSAAHLRAVDAARKAVLEAAQGVPYVQYLRRRFYPLLADDFAAVTSFEHGAAYYNIYPARLRQLRQRFGDLLRVERVGDLAGQSEDCAAAGMPAAETLNRLRSRLLRYGHHAYYLDVTSADLAAAGLTVVRALVPDYYTLEGSYSQRVRNDNRARWLARLGGWRVDYNYFPHPLP